MTGVIDEEGKGGSAIFMYDSARELLKEGTEDNLKKIYKVGIFSDFIDNCVK